MVSSLPLVQWACHGVTAMTRRVRSFATTTVHPRTMHAWGTWFAIEASGCEPIGLPHSDASATPTPGLSARQMALGEACGSA